MGPNASGGARDNRWASSSPPCAQCAGAQTEPVVTMRLHTADSGQWYRCDECGHVFATHTPGQVGPFEP
jgi:hypothetical protein